eukprot:TRINITY_DN3806_c1_g3_i1.p1 TRINITY_DN3806_c1_g3~~TRINITY_DN3806_c1_g3_i1.p1  ORF type:complete len:256 (-),score=33.06 TRINITY_DN3806_c1_g3_i1:5-772(-)
MGLQTLPFLIIALCVLVLCILYTRRLIYYLRNKYIPGVLCSSLVLFAMLSITVDNLRMFAGGFYEEFSSSGKNILYFLSLIHLTVVPLLIGVVNEYPYRLTRPHKHPLVAQSLRILVLVIAFVLFSCGVYNYSLQVCCGTFQKEEKFSSIRYSIEAHGEITLGSVGPQVLGVYAVLVGICIVWRSRPRRYAFLVIQLLAMLGQALGGLSPDYFWYASNYWEVWFFIGLLLEDWEIFGKDVLYKPPKTFNESANIV